MFQGAELIPYNIDSVLGQTSCIIHEGELDAASSLAAGFKSVISVPAGANSNLSWLDRFMETHFEDLTEVIIAVDTDSAGLQLRDELINRLGAERCRVVTYGPGCKDANEHLCKYGVASLRVAIEQAAEVPLEGVFTAADLHSDLLALFENGFGPGAETGWEEMDKICTYERGRLVILTGVPGAGKSEWLDVEDRFFQSGEYADCLSYPKVGGEADRTPFSEGVRHFGRAADAVGGVSNR